MHLTQAAFRLTQLHGAAPVLVLVLFMLFSVFASEEPLFK
jgi:uncharacterized protein (DUF486 family)